MLVLSLRLNNDSGFNRRIVVGHDTILEVVAQDRTTVTVSVLSPRARFAARMKLNEWFALPEYGGRVSLAASSGPGKVRLGFEFPKSVKIMREELIARATMEAIEALANGTQLTA